MPAPGVPPCCAEAAVTPASSARAAAAVSNFFMKELLPSHFAEHCESSAQTINLFQSRLVPLRMPEVGFPTRRNFYDFSTFELCKESAAGAAGCCNGTVYCGNKISHHSRKAVAGCGG